MNRFIVLLAVFMLAGCVHRWKNRTKFCQTIEKGRLRSPFFVPEIR